MVSLLYLKHAYNESDEGTVERWGESPVWQYFSGRDYFEHRRRPPLNESRKVLGKVCKSHRQVGPT